MSELSDTQPELHSPDGIVRIEGEQVKSPVPWEQLTAVAGFDEMIIPRTVTGESGEDEMWTFKAVGELPDGTRVEIVQDLKGDLHLLRPKDIPTTVEAPDSGVEIGDAVLPREKFGQGVMNALRARFGVRYKTESFGTDPDAVQTGTNLTILDMSGDNNHVRRKILPDHLNGGQQ